MHISSFVRITHDCIAHSALHTQSYIINATMETYFTKSCKSKWNLDY